MQLSLYEADGLWKGSFYEPKGRRSVLTARARTMTSLRLWTAESYPLTLWSTVAFVPVPPPTSLHCGACIHNCISWALGVVQFLPKRHTAIECWISPETETIVLQRGGWQASPADKLFSVLGLKSQCQRTCGDGGGWQERAAAWPLENSSGVWPWH